MVTGSCHEWVWVTSQRVFLEGILSWRCFKKGKEEDGVKTSGHEPPITPADVLSVCSK